MGIPEEDDEETLEKYYNARELPKFYIDAQISDNLSLSSLPSWPNHLPAQQFCMIARGLYLIRYGKNEKTLAYVRLLQILENIASTYQAKKEHANLDYLVQLTAEEDTAHEQSMVIRPLDAWCDGEFDTSELPVPLAGMSVMQPVPLVGVEFLHTRKVDGDFAHFGYLVKGTTEESRYLKEECSVEDMELLVKLLKTNAFQLNDAEDELVQKHEKHASEKGWSFSVVRAADPTKRGGALTCALCGKRAPLTCSRYVHRKLARFWNTFVFKQNRT